jgi:hypothetical protein
VSDENAIGTSASTHMPVTREHLYAIRGWKTIANLRLDIDAARAGKTWHLLPEGFRDQTAAANYPLPSRREDLQTLAGVVVNHHGRDGGVIYLRRAFAMWRKKQAAAPAVLANADRLNDAIRQKNVTYAKALNAMRTEAEQAVERVKQRADEAIASLTDLFALGRKGIEGQMRAHLDGVEWQGEPVNGRAFRECFRMVTQAVKGLGLPSDQRQEATKTIMEEIAASLNDTQATVALAPGASDPDETVQ